ncbi:hypothetical protein SCP_0606900 [Sparassis crispa]|uniref:MYND-type domain-containing protein n=1 Tax=Sparassis crispa TaxID=139825 RepID=A0A401GRD2_9APHY|nr:hypothetical protein SCP_0606900 [Sparassis crispa]GBE84710.1 hypothetical protein SCP_0606900 [Sparassis crispa]
MAHLLVWPGKYYLYAIGNTPAVCLTRDLASEEDADILLLGCGDPRNVLYTIFCEPQNSERKLDFTCCDFEPAILARNVILLTMLVDKLPVTTVVWNIFYHMYLDKQSMTVLTEHCKKLISISDTLQHWNDSRYGTFIKMCTEYTLAEIRRHWSLFADMQNLPGARLQAIRDAFSELSKSVSQKKGTTLTSARSAGPLLVQAIRTTAEQFRLYWRNGVTFSDSKQITAAKLVNPTFVYSLAGEGCPIHYATDPLVPFHIGSVFGNAKGSVTVSDVVKAARFEFNDWCLAFLSAISTIGTHTAIIRFFVGEATAVCRVLRGFSTTGILNSTVPVAQWKTQLIQLNREDYMTGGAPASFNVIETSNLDDHIGLLNVLIAAVPLLSTSTYSNVIYTESLLSHEQDSTKEFSERLYADIGTMGFLLGLCPVDYLAGYTTRSNTHELMMYQFLGKKDVTQFHQVTTWKSPYSGDSLALQNGVASRPPDFDSRQLGTLFYDIYFQLFQLEDASRHFNRHNGPNMMKAFRSSNILHYMRESFVLLLKLVRDRLRISHEQWLEVMDRFIEVREADTSLSMDSVNFQDLCAHLYRHGVYTIFFIPVMPPGPRIGIFSEWDTVPTLVRIILIVPREKLDVLDESNEQVGTPILQCDLRGTWSHNVYSAVHVAFGRATKMGTKARPWVSFEEDPDGKRGTSPLVASFTVAVRALTEIEPMQQLSIGLSVRSTLGTVMLTKKLGLTLSLFSAPLMDESHVLVLPEPSLPSRAVQAPLPSPSQSTGPLIGGVGDVSVELDEQCELVSSMTCKVSVEDEEVKTLFGSQGATPEISQVSPCVMRLTVGRHVQNVVYPFPVIGSQNRLRLARKSLYIEVIVSPFGPFKSDGMKLNPFPVVRSEKTLALWSIHHVNLSRMPVLDIKASQVAEWLNPHIGSMMSKRERSLRRKHKDDDVLTLVKDTVHTIFVHSTGLQAGPARRLFALQDDATRNCDTIFFISDIRFDLHSHTVVCDGYVLPLTKELIMRTERSFTKLIAEGNLVNVAAFKGEMQAWKQLLPALVERCRSSWQHGDNCEYKSQGRIPLTTEMEADPLCSCGRGKDTDGMSKVALWKNFAPYVTRIALSPLFAVSYLETVGRDPAAHKCSVCRGRGKPKLRACGGCKKVRYCSEACQKKDWKAHKLRCKA